MSERERWRERCHVKDFQLKIGGHDIPATDCTKNLGVIFDQTLSMDKQINSVSRVNLFHLRNICVDCSVMTPLLSSSILSSLQEKLPNKLQRIQNIAARVQTRAPPYDHMTPILYSLHWLPVRARVKYKYNAIHGKAP